VAEAAVVEEEEQEEEEEDGGGGGDWGEWRRADGSGSEEFVEELSALDASLILSKERKFALLAKCSNCPLNCCCCCCCC